ncbi:hypothetical protein SCLCIDRAFT_123741 [Scleroderma citrinum Foug A]|uniref:Uncharacterized protein n=1 Tax=Scleroderma citrinum Foug A TaxID=1036808 RepID=A0A0C3A718_9AGAM|nr:hypothetical protein SCLCIDRAFT_123741 [Scleroderma citrinum Foug A]
MAEREINVHYPFKSRAEWSLARFLVENFTQSQINKFLSLPWVSHLLTLSFNKNPSPGFRSAEELLHWINTLPPGPKWQSMILEVEGYKTVDPILLIWRDGLEVAESLFGDPIFGAHMRFDPLHINGASGREYGEWFSAMQAHKIQVGWFKNQPNYFN